MTTGKTSLESHAVAPFGIRWIDRTYNYRLAYVNDGKCVVRYDNERGKGDHRHFGGEETQYDFSTPRKLVADFEADIVRWNHENSHS